MVSAVGRDFVGKYASHLDRSKLPEMARRFGSEDFRIVFDSEIEQDGFMEKYLDLPMSAVAGWDTISLFKRMNGAGYLAKDSAGRIIGNYGRRRDENAVLVYGNFFDGTRNLIAGGNTGLVYAMAGHYYGLDEDDALSEGFDAYGRAIKMFNPWKPYRFSTYACNAIARALSRLSKKNLKGLRRRVPFEEDYAAPEPIELACDDTELNLGCLRREMDGLDKLSRRILEHRFPLDDSPQKTFRQIESVVGLSKERVRQIQNNALKTLRIALTGK